MQKMKKTIEGGGSEFFICFTSRPSSSNKSSSKTLISPNRNPSSIPSLSSSLSRRLRSSGSIKGGQSPTFPSAFAAAAAFGRKKGAAFEAAEPSSPKVTCIGQVRGKSKKKKNKNKNHLVNRSRSVRGGSDASFRKPVSICDALNCFVPRGWSLCSSRGDEDSSKREKRQHRSSSSSSSSSSTSCGAVFARWLMAIQETEEEKGREFVGLIVREEKVELKVEEFMENKEDEDRVLHFAKEDEDRVLRFAKEEEENEEEARVSVCIPPRNALLLMRCRSDPVRMAALSNRFWDSPAMKVQCEEEEEQEDEEKEKVVESCVNEEKEEEVSDAGVEKRALDEEEAEKGVVLDEENKLEALEEVNIIVSEEVEKEVQSLNEELQKKQEQEDMLDQVISAEAAKPIENVVEKELKEKVGCVQREGDDEVEEVEIVLRRSISCSATKSNDFAKAKEGGKRRSFSFREKKEKRRHSFSAEGEARGPSFCSEKDARRSSFSLDKEGRRRWSFSIEKENLGPKPKPISQIAEPAQKEEPAKPTEPEKIIEKTQVVAAADKARGREEDQVVEREKKGRELPDCLLLMMYEPKLSMEVSKETWVCSNDFVHWRPHQANQQSKPKAEEKPKVEEKAIVEQQPPPQPQPQPQPQPKPTVSVSPMEQKLLKSTVAIGPFPQAFVLTRCKSEPGKSSARLAPESCFWKARHQPIGAAGIGL